MAISCNQEIKKYIYSNIHLTLKSCNGKTNLNSNILKKTNQNQVKQSPKLKKTRGQ